MKLLLLITIAFAGIKGNAFIDATKSVIAQFEMYNIAHLITLDSISEQRIRPESFAQYLRKNMKVPFRKSRRDTAKDPWNHFYKLAQWGTELSILSAGPDGKFGTRDDLRMSAN